MATDYTPYATLTQKGYANSCDETAVMQYLDQYGPLGIAIIASSNGFQSYSSGIMTNADLGLSSETSSFTCSQNIDHAVTLVGYGTDDGQDYWLVKNSWGTSWGENGYFKAARGTGGCSTACITFMASWGYSTTVDPSNNDLTFEMDDDFTTLTPTTPTDSSDPSSTSSTSSSGAKMNGWETALLVIGCVAVAVGAVVGGYAYNKQNMKKRQEITQNFIQSQHNEI